LFDERGEFNMKRFLLVGVVMVCMLCMSVCGAYAEGLVFEEGIYKVTFPGGKVTTRYIENVPLPDNGWNNFANGFIIHKDADSQSAYRSHGYIDEKNERLVYANYDDHMVSIGIYQLDENGNIVGFDVRGIDYKAKDKTLYVDLEKDYTKYEILK